MKNRPYTAWCISTFLLAASVFASHPSPALATPEYAQQTGLECRACHIDPSGGGPLTGPGKRFLEGLKSSGRYRPLGRTQRVVRLFVGYFHMMAAIMWFGTIMYVHILLKPAYASQGLPRGELRVGWISMLVLIVTGTLLTIARIPSFEQFFTTRFGILLGIKIILFLVMLTSAAVVTLIIGPRLRRKTGSPVAVTEGQDMTLEQLAHFDGKEGRPAYIAYKGVVYNVGRARLWKNGVHAVKHAAGKDLTDSLKTAPHGEEKILAMPRVGALSAEKPGQPAPVRAFYFIAYMNLVLVFIITFIIALWRWW